MGEVLLSPWTLVVYMAIGFSLVKSHVVGPSADRGLSKIVFYVTMPALLVRTVATADLADVFARALLVLTALASIPMLVLVAAIFYV